MHCRVANRGEAYVAALTFILLAFAGQDDPLKKKEDGDEEVLPDKSLCWCRFLELQGAQSPAVCRTVIMLA